MTLWAECALAQYGHSKVKELNAFGCENRDANALELAEARNLTIQDT